MDRDALFRAIDAINIRIIAIGDHTITLGTVIVSVFIIAFSYAFSLLVQRGIKRALGSGEADASSYVSMRLAHYVIVWIGFSIALQTAGIDLRALFTAGAVFAVGIGFAMQNIAQNFVSGVILLVEHSIRPGDVLEIEGKQVRVVEMGIRSTRVRSRDDEVLIVPNSTLVQTTVRSYTLLDTLCRVRVGVGVAYSSDMEKVRTTLLETARALPERSQAKEPLLLLMNFGPSSVDWEVSIWIEDPWKLRPSASTLRYAVWNAFDKAGIRMAYPQVDVHLDEPVISALGSSRAA
jgi:small-conductance mechanosensitive channel